MARRDDPPKFTEPNDDGIQSYLFGGLNTSSTPLNTPYEDSPLLQNVDTNIEGSVSKRKGSKLLTSESANLPTGLSVVPFTSPLNYNLLVMKNGTSLNIYEVKDDVATRIVNKTNVWSSAAQTQVASTVRTAETEPRVLFFTSGNKPVQVRFIEQQSTQTGTAVTSVAITNAARYKNATALNCIVFINRVRVTATPAFSYNAGTATLTVSNLPATTGTFVVDILLITWQWWAEAMLWDGDRYFKSSTRFNAAPTDQVVPIPESVRTDLDVAEGTDTNWDIVPYYKSNLAYGYTYVGRQPDTAVKWGFSDGSRYIYHVDNYLSPTQFFITFGALEAGAQPTDLYWVRRRELRLNNNEGISTANIDCYVNKSLRTWRITNVGSVYQDYWLHERVADGFGGWQANPITVATGKTAYYLSFEASVLGLPGDAIVEVINKEAIHIGSSAITTKYDYNDGSYYPVYGIGLYADYKNGYYPSSVELSQGRLILSGFANAPLTVVFSNIYDSVTPGEFFNFFQVTDDLAAIATDPFDITINGRPDDRLVAVVEYQSSLFVLNRRSTYRISGGQAPISITNNQTIFISNIGCVNNQSYCKTDKDVLYVSDSGVYNLLPQIENQEYQASELSIKIRNYFGITKDNAYEGLPWLEFDADNKRVYFGYPILYDTSVCRRLFVFSTVRESWTEYTTPSGFNSFTGVPYVDRTLGNNFLLAVTTYRSGSTPSDFNLLKLNNEIYLDYLTTSTGTGASQNILIVPQPSYTYVTAANQHLYSISPTSSSTATVPQYYTFDSLPVQEVEDVIVTLNGVKQVSGTDYIKTPGNYIYLGQTPTAGQTLTIRPRRPITDSERGQAFYGVLVPTDIGHEVVIVDHVQSLVYTTQTISSKQYVTLSAAIGAVIQTGSAYLAVYSTPVFTNQQLRSQKQRKWVYAYFDNSIGHLLYSSADTNATSGQLTTAITDTPKLRVNANITLTFSSENSGETTADVYGFESLVWDDTLFDVNAPSSSYQAYQLFKEPIRGTGYSYQMLIWNYDIATWKLVGFQIQGTQKGRSK